MGKKSILRAALCGALVLPPVAAWQPARAQQAGTAPQGGVVLTFSIDERLSAGNNLALAVPAEGRTLASDTRLSFGLTSTTPIERLSVGASTNLRISDEPGGGVTDFERPQLTFAYARNGANADLTVNGRYRSDRVEFLRDLSAFADPGTGVITLPPDFGDLNGTGTRADYALDATLDLGTQAPLGITLDAGISGRDYQDVTDPNLIDTRTLRAGATARLRLSPVTDARLGVRRSVSTDDDVGQTEVTTDRVDLGLAHDFSARSRVDASIGYSVSTTENGGVQTAETKGVVGQVDYQWDMPDGRYDASYQTTVDEDGRRTTLSFGRIRDLPLGQLVARLGVTGRDGLDDPEIVGTLSWSHNLPDGSLSMSLDRAVRSTGPATDAQATTVSMSLDRSINAVSGVSLGANYGIFTEDGANDITRAGLTATYRHNLTQDWAMNLGLAWRLRDEDTVGRATSEEIFVSLGRSFSWRR